MDAEDADVVRRLLSYEEATAGGMMTPELIVLGPTATVAEALAQIRDPDWVVEHRRPGVRVPAAVQGRRPASSSAPPTCSACCASRRAWSCATASPRTRSSRPTPPTVAVAELLASYDMLAVAVCDAAGRLLGAVTVDDVLDRQLGVGWRQRQRGVTNRTRTA